MIQFNFFHRFENVPKGQPAPLLIFHTAFATSLLLFHHLRMSPSTIIHTAYPLYSSLHKPFALSSLENVPPPPKTLIHTASSLHKPSVCFIITIENVPPPPPPTLIHTASSLHKPLCFFITRECSPHENVPHTRMFPTQECSPHIERPFPPILIPHITSVMHKPFIFFSSLENVLLTERKATPSHLNNSHSFFTFFLISLRMHPS